MIGMNTILVQILLLAKLARGSVPLRAEPDLIGAA